MSTIREYYNQAEFALAAYAELYQGIEEQDYINALQNDGKGMSLSQATAFAAKWEVVDSFSDDTGVSAAVFKRRNDASGQTYLAIRGTDSV
jgi:hypothetical protein